MAVNIIGENVNMVENEHETTNTDLERIVVIIVSVI